MFDVSERGVILACNALDNEAPPGRLAPQACSSHRAVRKRDPSRDPKPERGIRGDLLGGRYRGNSAAHNLSRNNLTLWSLLFRQVLRQQTVVTAEVELATRDLR